MSIYEVSISFTENAEQTRDSDAREIAKKYNAEMVGHGQMLCTPAVVDAQFRFKTEEEMREAADTFAMKNYEVTATIFEEEDDEEGEEVVTPWMAYAQIGDILFNKMGDDCADRWVALEYLMFPLLDDWKPEYQREMITDLINRVFDIKAEVELEQSTPAGTA
jgi:hypothetical protein